MAILCTIRTHLIVSADPLYGIPYINMDYQKKRSSTPSCPSSRGGGVERDFVLTVTCVCQNCYLYYVSFHKAFTTIFRISCRKIYYYEAMHHLGVNVIPCTSKTRQKEYFTLRKVVICKLFDNQDISLIQKSEPHCYYMLVYITT